MAKKVGVVILGDEVLKGEVREANLAYMLPLLNEWGAETVLCAVLPDKVPVVVRHLKAYLEEADLLILTGGIGPTPDDITARRRGRGRRRPAGARRRGEGGPRIASFPRRGSRDTGCRWRTFPAERR